VPCVLICSTDLAKQYRRGKVGLKMPGCPETSERNISRFRGDIEGGNIGTIQAQTPSSSNFKDINKIPPRPRDCGNLESENTSSLLTFNFPLLTRKSNSKHIISRCTLSLAQPGEIASLGVLPSNAGPRPASLRILERSDRRDSLAEKLADTADYSYRVLALVPKSNLVCKKVQKEPV
jgi:hypothetical protein